MAIGFIPNYTQDLGLDGLTHDQFLAACITAANSLDWDIRYISDSGIIAFTGKKMFRRKQKFSVRIENGIATIRSESTGNEMVDWGRNRKNVEQFIARTAEVKNSMSPSQMDRTYEELKPGLVPRENDVLSQPPPTAKQQWSNFFSLFIPRKNYFITPLLVDLNIAIFILMTLGGASPFSPDIQTLLNWGANVRSLTLNGQWWRIITCCFIHIGIIHLLLNMYALLYIGLLLEPQLGRRRFASAYLLTGIMASVASLCWHENTVSAGASGAIFGMYGVFLALLTTNIIEKTARNTLLISIGIFVGYNLLYGTHGNVDNSAHVGVFHNCGGHAIGRGDLDVRL
jgi:rhomboid protease GluP